MATAQLRLQPESKYTSLLNFEIIIHSENTKSDIKLKIPETCKIIQHYVETKDASQAFYELQKAGKILKDHKLISSFKITPKVQNIVARFNINKKIPIEHLAKVLPKSMYEPEQFPGLIFRIQNSLVALIFASGSCVLVGAKSINELNRGFYEISRWLEN